MKKILFTSFLFLFPLITVAASMSSPSYYFDSDTISSMGGSLNSTNYQIQDSLGAEVAGESSSSGYNLFSGFIYPSSDSTTTTAIDDNEDEDSDDDNDNDDVIPGVVSPSKNIVDPSDNNNQGVAIPTYTAQEVDNIKTEKERTDRMSKSDGVVRDFFEKTKYLGDVSRFVATPGGQMATISGSVFGVVATVSMMAIYSTSLFSFPSFIKAISLVGFGIFSKKRKKWGVVFESQTKSPLSFVSILVFNRAGKVVDRAITDSMGRFGLLVTKGEYYLEVKRDGFSFPSKKVESGSNDEVYGFVYNGGVFRINEDQVIEMSIPMDAEKFDLVEISRDKIDKINSLGGKISIILINSVFYLCFGLTIISQIVAPSIVSVLFLVFYFCITVYRLFFRKRDYGLLVDSDTKKPVPFAIIKVFKEDDGVVKRVKIVVTDMLGRYYSLVDNGKYNLNIQGNNIENKIVKSQKDVIIMDGTLNEYLRT